MKSKEILNYISDQIKTLDRSTIPTGILSLPIFNDVSSTWKGSSSNILSYKELDRCISHLKFGMVDNEFELPSYFQIMERKNNDVIQMGMFRIVYNCMAEQQTEEFLSLKSNDEIMETDFNSFFPKANLEEETFFVSLPLRDKVGDGSRVNFCFDSSIYFDSNRSAVPVISFDAGDGNGFRNVKLDENIEVSYHDKGIKELNVKVQYEEQSFTTTSTLEVIQTNLPAPDQSYALTAKHYYKHQHATGKVKIYYADKAAKLKKPLYFWTGFNTGISATTIINHPLEVMEASAEELFASNYDNFLKIALDNGYDIVVLEWDDPRNYIQNNGFLAATLIQKINTEFPQSSDGVIVTGSMGGLIARWAALYMEHEEGRNLYGSHNLKKLITLDTPHEGAVMPIAMQYAVDYLAANIPYAQGDAAREGRKVIQSPAACQMLVQQFMPNWSHQDEPKPHQERDLIIKNWNEWGGYPKELKTYAVSNGSKLGKGQTSEDGNITLKPGAYLLSGAYNLSGWGDVLWIDYLKASPSFLERHEPGTEVLNIVFYCKPRWTATIKKSLPYDSCPGGNYKFIPSIGNQLNVRVNMPVESTCFIPTLSSVGIQNDNLYRLVDENQPGPFEKIYVPDENQPHASLNNSNTKWIMDVLGIQI